MELLYVWFKEYKGLNTDPNGYGFNLGGEYSFKFDYQKKELTATKNENYIKNFFDEDGQISNVTAIVGKNGAGKSTFLDFVLYQFDHNFTLTEMFIIAYLYKGEICFISHINDIEFDKKTLKKIPLNDFQLNIGENIKKRKSKGHDYEFNICYLSNVINTKENRSDLFDKEYLFDKSKTYRLKNNNIETLCLLDYKLELEYLTFIKEKQFISMVNFPNKITINFGFHFFEQEFDKFLDKQELKLLNNPDLKREYSRENKWASIIYEPPYHSNLKARKYLIDYIIDKYDEGDEYEKDKYENGEYYFFYNYLKALKYLEGEDVIEYIKFSLISFFIYMIDKQAIEDPNKSEYVAGYSFQLSNFSAIFHRMIDEYNWFNSSELRKNLKIIFGYNETNDFYVENLQQKLDLLEELISHIDTIQWTKSCLTFDKIFNKDIEIEFLLTQENLNSISKFILMNINLVKALKINKSWFTINWRNLSSGEEALINLFAQVLALKDDLLGNHLLLLIDEPDTLLHPEWQRSFLKEFISRIKQICKVENIQIIYATNNPILTSDLPTGNICYLNKEEKDGERKIFIDKSEGRKSFGANIYDIMSDGFYMDSFIGEFASKKIQTTLEWLNDENRDMNKVSDHLKLIELIDEPMVKSHMKNLAEEKGLVDVKSMSKTEKQKKIEQLKQELAKYESSLDKEN